MVASSSGGLRLLAGRDRQRICEPGGGGWVLPLFSDEQQWDPGLRSVLYATGLIYCFLGVSMIADVFMTAIDAVTSRRKKVRLKCERQVTLKVWNDTISNLSFMALGSSAPEISLSVIELFRKKMHAGDLGASTIVGSAAFNLLVIVSVCIFVIPSGEIRAIKQISVFYVTALFSLFAYVWMVCILNFHTPNVVDIPEAALTFLFFPVLIYVSYLTDLGKLDVIHRVFMRMLRCRDQQARQASDEEPAKPNQQHTPHAVTGPAFAAEHMTVRGTSQSQKIEIAVRRPADCRGALRCTYRTEKFTATPGADYVEAEGTLDFSEGIAAQQIGAEILSKGNHRTSRIFLVILEGEDLEFDPETDGGTQSAILTVTIEAVADSVGRWGRLMRGLDGAIDINGLWRGNLDWMDQFLGVLRPEPDGDGDENRTSLSGWGFHFVALPWKLAFTLVPPTSYCGGWICFIASLFVIAGITVIIADLSELFGCVLDVPDIVTAVTFVAIGTSMPDLFASRIAATEDPTADASIVNVTGSNSVNVFLGLGLPWTMGSIYWACADRDTGDWSEIYKDHEVFKGLGPNDGPVFLVESRNLSFSVMVFVVCCLVSISILMLRREMLGGELGGPLPAKVATSIAFIVFWSGYVGLTAWRVLRWESSDLAEEVLVIGGVCIIEALVALWPTAVIVRTGFRMRNGQAQETVTDEESQSKVLNFGSWTASTIRTPAIALDDHPPVENMQSLKFQDVPQEDSTTLVIRAALIRPVTQSRWATQAGAT